MTSTQLQDANKDGFIEDLKEDVDLVEDASNRAQLAARYTESEKHLSFWEAAKLYWRSSLWILYGLLLVFNFGMDGIIAGYQVSVPKFREDYGTPFDTGTGVVSYIISADWLAIFSAVAQAGAVLGAMVAGYLADKVGRRYATGISCLVSVAGVAAQFWSNGSLGILTAGKAINGVPIGMWMVLSPLYASEVAPLRLRGVLASMTNSSIQIGVLSFTGVFYAIGAGTTRSAYMIPFACQWIVPGFILVTLVFWPESPVWLVRVGKREKAIKALRSLHGSKSPIDKEGILAQIEETLAFERSQAGHKDNLSYLECFKTQHRSRTLIVMFVYCCQYLSGNTFIIGYGTYFYQLRGYSAKTSLLFGLVFTSFTFAVNIVAWFVIANVRRRPLIVWGQLAAASSLFIIGGCSTVIGNKANITILVFCFVWGFLYQVSMATVGWTVGSEIPALHMRARTQGLANMVLNFMSWLMAFVFPYMFNPDAGNLRGKVGFFFGATTFVGFVGTYFFLPESKGRTPAELETLFDRGISPKNFHKIDLDTAI